MASKLTSSGTIKGKHGDLFYEREGNADGQSILFVHGLGGTTNAFQTLVPELQDYDLIRFDWTGHGRSGTPKDAPNNASVDAFVEDCISVLDELKVKSPIVAAHSLGGLVALHLATKRDIKALVLFGPVQSPPEAGQKALAGRVDAVMQNGMVGIADTVVSNAFAAESFTSRRTAVALAREMLTRQNPAGYAFAVNALKDSTMPDFGKIKGKTIILSGSEDKVSAVAVGEGMVGKLGSNAEQVKLDSVGHWHMLEDPSSCVEAIKKVAG